MPVVRSFIAALRRSLLPWAFFGGCWRAGNRFDAFSGANLFIEPVSLPHPGLALLAAVSGALVVGSGPLGLSLAAEPIGPAANSGVGEGCAVALYFSTSGFSMETLKRDPKEPMKNTQTPTTAVRRRPDRRSYSPLDESGKEASVHVVRWF